MEIVSKTIEVEQKYAGRASETKQHDHLDQNECTA